MVTLSSISLTNIAFPSLIGHAAQFLEWSGGFDLPGCQDTISLLLVESPDVRRLHTELVGVVTKIIHAPL